MSKGIRRVLLSWSSGKDSAWCLHVLRQRTDVEVVGLFTSFNEAADRVAMHEVRRELVAAQAAAVGLPLMTVELPWPCDNKHYEQAMHDALYEAKAELHATTIAFGDLFLEDIRHYRDRQLMQWGLEGLYPLWGQSTSALANEMLEAGVRAIITCVDPKQCPPGLVGRYFDQSLLEMLPSTVDPCGENGEFHTFAFDSPDFSVAIEIALGGIANHGDFVYADVMPTR